MTLFNSFIREKAVRSLALILFGVLVSFASFGQAPVPITGAGGICAGQARSFADATSGGTWSTSNSAVVTVGSSTGFATGEALGTATITYTTGGGIATITATVTPIPCGPVVLSNVCVGATVVEMGCMGTWSTGTTSVATIDSVTGAVTGIIPGSASIISTSVPGCYVTNTITVYPAPPPIFGVTSFCAGASAALTDFMSAGTWSSANISVASVTATGTVFGVSSGTAAISYSSSLGCAASKVITVDPFPVVYTLSTGGSYCSGATGVDITLSGSNTGINYQLFIPGGPTPPAPVPGIGGPLDFGLHTVGTYKAIAENTVTGCTDTMAGSATVSGAPLPTPYTVSGGGSYCAGGTGVYVHLSGSDMGVIYRLYSGATEVDSLPGTGATLDFGPQTLTGTYVVIAKNSITGCTNTMTGAVSVSLYPTPVISGPIMVCAGATISETAPGFTAGIWGSSNTAIATAGGPTGVIAGISPGTATITFTSASTGCTGTTIVTVNLSPTPISGPRSVCIGSTTTLNATPAGGLWSSSNVTAATISSTGVVTGVSAGITIISYSIGSGCVVTTIVTVNPLPNVYTLSGGGGYCAGGTGIALTLSDSDTGVSYGVYSGSVAFGSVSGTGGALPLGTYSLAGIYTVIAINADGCLLNMFGFDTITINPLPTVHNITGGGSYCAGGSGLHIGLDGSNNAITYGLYNGGALVTTMSGTGSSLDFGEYISAGVYHIVATNTYGCNSIMAGNDTITILPSPSVYSVTGGGSYCAGAMGAHIGLDNSDVGFSYQLFNGVVSVGAPIAGIGLSLDFGLSIDTGLYTVVATNIATGCTAAMSGSARISIIPLPSVFTVTGGGSYCTGGSGVAIGLSSSHTGVNYQLYDGSSIVGTSMAGTGSPLDFGAESATGVYKITAINPTGAGCMDTMAGSATITISSLPAAYSVTGGGSRCASGSGITIGLVGSSAGVDYTLYNGGSVIASMPGSGSSLDFGLGIAAGTYTVVATTIATTCTSNMTGSAIITVIPSVTPSLTTAVTPGGTVCEGASVAFTLSYLNGGSSPMFTWIVNGHSVSSDSVYTYTPGNGDIVYAVMNSSATCAAPLSATSLFTTMHVLSLPAISGGSSVCAGSSITLADTSGGVWASSNPAIATVATIGAATGVVSGVSVGTAVLTYTLDTACTVTATLTVRALPAITASSSVVSCGGAYTLSGGGGVSYIWSPAIGVSCATCATTDVVPTATTAYYVTGTDAYGCSNSAAVTVDGNRISGYISPALPGGVKVWLIQFNASDSSIAALDSTTSCMSGGQPYYEFDDKPAGNYLVKAFLVGGTPGASGYIPTYGSSNPHWDSASSVIHAAAADTLHIDLIYGTVPTGPGFIGGLISSGAGRGTSMDVPAAGMLVYLIDAASNRVLTYNYTDSNGAYSFSNIAYGNYVIYPEDYDYITTPWPTISLTSNADSLTNASFKQHTTARTITPITIPAGIDAAVFPASEIQVYPNPTSGSLNIQWNNQPVGNSVLFIADMLGRGVYKSTIKMTSTSGDAPVDISSLKNGIYLVSIKTAITDFNGKLIIEK